MNESKNQSIFWNDQVHSDLYCARRIIVDIDEAIGLETKEETVYGMFFVPWSLSQETFNVSNSKVTSNAAIEQKKIKSKLLKAINEKVEVSASCASKMWSKMMMMMMCTYNKQYLLIVCIFYLTTTNLLLSQ